ncbi:MAG: NusG domain II-containing protein [Clostridia bacterium]|nr:NusG domain II-containing protein [Clostridia bacterium]
MKKKDAAVILSILLLAALFFSFRMMLAGSGPRGVVVIQVDGKEYARIPLSEPQTVRIEQENGAVNVLEVTREGARMRDASCPDGLCVGQGQVTPDNYMSRPTQAFIICLPHRVTAELIPEQVP